MAKRRGDAQPAGAPHRTRQSLRAPPRSPIGSSQPGVATSPRHSRAAKAPSERRLIGGSAHREMPCAGAGEGLLQLDVAALEPFYRRRERARCPVVRRRSDRVCGAEQDVGPQIDRGEDCAGRPERRSPRAMRRLRKPPACPAASLCAGARAGQRPERPGYVSRRRSAPIRELVDAIRPAPLSTFSARALRYRDLLTVALIARDAEEALASERLVPRRAAA